MGQALKRDEKARGMRCCQVAGWRYQGRYVPGYGESHRGILVVDRVIMRIATAGVSSSNHSDLLLIGRMHEILPGEILARSWRASSTRSFHEIIPGAPPATRLRTRASPGGLERGWEDGPAGSAPPPVGCTHEPQEEQEAT